MTSPRQHDAIQLLLEAGAVKHAEGVEEMPRRALVRRGDTVRLLARGVDEPAARAGVVGDEVAAGGLLGREAQGG